MGLVLVLVLVFVLLVFVRPSQVRSGQERKGKVKSGAHVWRFDIPRPLFEDTASTDGKRCWIFLFFLCVYNFGNYLYECDGTDIGCDYLLGAMLCYAILCYAMLLHLFLFKSV